MSRPGLTALVLTALSISTAFAAPSPRDAYENLQLNKKFNQRDALQLVLDHPGKTNDLPANFDEKKRTVARAVGFLMIQDAKTGKFTSACSGAMISADFFLTARHCASGVNENYYVFFDYQKESEQDQPKIPVNRLAYAFQAETKYVLRNSDAMILKLAGSPGLKQGWLKMSLTAPQRGAKLFAIHHPNAEPKTLSDDCVLVHSEKVTAESFLQRFQRPYDLRATCSVAPGSSGGPILNESGEIIGIARYMDMAITGFLFNGIINVLNEIEKDRELDVVHEALEP